LAAIVLAGACFLAPVVWIARPRPFQTDPLPDPNGYDDLVAAGRSFTGEMPVPPNADYSQVDEESLRIVVERNRKALDLARVGLARKRRVRLPDMAGTPEHIETTTALRVLGRLLACEVALAEREGDTEKAIAASLDGIRLGHAAGDGGILLDRMVGAAVENVAMISLGRLASQVSPNEGRRLAAEVLQIEEAHEPIARVVDRDLRFTRSKGAWRTRPLFVVRPGLVKSMIAPSVKAAEEGDRRTRAFLRLLAAKLALRAFEGDHPGEPPPATLEALVPTYLPHLPADPYGTGPLKLRVEAAGARPYSIGPDGKDDGGNPVGKWTRFDPKVPGDMTLDAP
jgi:hypothetical protein